MIEKNTMKPTYDEHELYNDFPEKEKSSGKMKEPSLAACWQTGDEDPDLKKESGKGKEGDRAALGGKPLGKVKSLHLSEKPSLNLKCSAPSVKRPFTLTAACLDEIAKGHFEISSKKKENISRKKSNSSYGGSLQKKLNQAALDHIKKEYLKNDIVKNVKKSENLFTNCQGIAESEKNRFEEIEKRRKRIAKLILCAEKSLTSILKKKRDKNYFTNVNHSLSPATKHSSNVSSLEKEDAETKHKKLILGEHRDSKTEETKCNQVEISLVEVRKPFSPMNSSHATDVVGIVRTSIKSPSDSTTNAEELTDGEVITVRQEKDYLLSNVCLKNFISKDIKKEQPKKECDLKKEIETVSETLMNTNLSLKDMEQMFFEKDSAIAQLRFYINKLQGLSGKLKEKDDLIMDLENQNTELKDENDRIIKELERRFAEQQSLNKDKEKLKNLIRQLREEKDSLKLKISEMSGKIIEKEKELTNILEILNDERQNHTSSRKKQDLTFSAKLENLSEQLVEKDAVISQLRTLRDSVQLINREVCCMLASVFNEFGRKKSETEIESLISTGRTLAIKDSLISMIEKNGEKGAETNHEECMEVISSLEDRMTVLEAELEESKNYTETLVGVISTGKASGEECGGDKRELMKSAEHVLKRSENTLTEDAAFGDERNFSCSLLRGDLPRNFYELFVLLECKRQALLQMERKVQDLEEVHSNCNYKRVRNETRIENLEMELAAIKLPEAKKFILRQVSL